MPGAEQMLRTMHLLEDDVASLLRLVEIAVAGLAAGDPLLEDLLEIRDAAEKAVTKTENLVASASFVPLLRAS